MLHAEPLPIEKNIKKTLDGRSFNRIQMQMPYGESSIIFLVSNEHQHSSLWTNCLIELVNHDMKIYTGRHFYPKLKKLDGVFTDGLVQLPKVLNYTGSLGVANVPTRCCLRVINGSEDCGPYNSLVDTFCATDIGRSYRHHQYGMLFSHLEWICPDVPEGGIVVWHGFHTTKGDKHSITPKATMFLDFAEHDQLSVAERTHYAQLIRQQPFDPGSGNPNARGSRATIEFNAAKNIQQAPSLGNSTLVGGTETTSTCGHIHVDRQTILQQGYGIIMPLEHGRPVPNGCFPWFMTATELEQYHALRRASKFEFERFLTYFVFEREMRYLTCWLVRYSRLRGFAWLWNKMEHHTELFDKGARRFKWPEAVRDIVQQNGEPQDVEQLRSLYHARSNKTLSNMTPSQIIQFHYNSWVYLFRTARLLDIDVRPGRAIFPEQSRCWFAMFGGRYGNKNMTSTKAAQAFLNDSYFMYWRLGMGSQAPSRSGEPAMCVGTTLADVHSFIERKVNDGPVAHLHRRMAQGGGRIIAGDSGMGAGTTYMHGRAHLEIQTGRFGATLAKAFYKNPLVVLERFRVKTHASWGAGHVDHDVQSRPRMIQYVSKSSH